MSDFFDGSYALYALYNEKTAEFDRELVNNWLEHVRDLMVLVGQTPLCSGGTSMFTWTPIEWSTLGGYCGFPCTVLYNIPTVLRGCLGCQHLPYSGSELAATSQLWHYFPDRLGHRLSTK